MKSIAQTTIPNVQMTQYFLKIIIEREKVKKNEETQHEKEGKIEDGMQGYKFFCLVLFWTGPFGYNLFLLKLKTENTVTK